MEGGKTNHPHPHHEQANDPGDEPEAEMEPQLRPRIYVASLSDYNAGRLHGIWLDADQDPEDLRLHITAMLRRSRQPAAEEWAIHDFEGFNGLHLGEWENLEHVSRVATGIKEHGAAFAHWATLVSDDDGLDRFEETYLGTWNSLTDYADHILEDLGLDQELDRCVPENLRPYVTLDAAGFGRDLQLGGDITVVEGEGRVYVFGSQ
jgi:antirestriction protein